MRLYYERQLEAKIGRQKKEIKRLLKENAELKGLNSTICDVCKNDEFLKETAEQARAAGQEEAWELAQKVYLLPESGGYNSNELIEIFGTASTSEIFSLTHTEAAAKVAEWKRKKEEICVWDEVELINGVKFFVTYSCDGIVNGVSGSGQFFEGILVQECKKTGRHIDVSTWLAQIGGEE